MADPLIGMTFSFAPAAPSQERDDAPRGGNGSQVLPVAELGDDFSGQPVDGSQYLFLVRREASRRAKITSVPNPYEVVAAETSVVSASKAIPVSRPEEAWRESFVRNFAAARKRMLHAPLEALEPIDPADIPPPRHESSWRIFINGKRAKPTRTGAAKVSATPTDISESGMDVDSAPADELAAMKAALLASLESEDAPSEAARTDEQTAPAQTTTTQSSAGTHPAAGTSSGEAEYERLPRMPSPSLVAAIPAPSIIHVLSHFNDWLQERFEAYEDRVNYVPSTIFAPASLRRKAGAASKPASLAQPARAVPAAAPSRPAVGRPPLPSAHESHWMLSLLTRLEQVLDGDDLATLRQLAKTLVQLVEEAERAKAARTRPEEGWSMETRRGDEQEAEEKARCWMIVAAIASVWAQRDLWDPSL